MKNRRGPLWPFGPLGFAHRDDASKSLLGEIEASGLKLEPAILKHSLDI
jgi:hypothetical protein